MNNSISPYGLYGMVCRDQLTGFEGVCIGIIDWMFGCRVAILQPLGKKKTPKDCQSISFGKLQIVGPMKDLCLDISEYTEPKFFGKICRDKVTGYVGMAIGRASIFYSSDQYTLEAKVKKGSTPVEPITIDEGRLELVENDEGEVKPEDVQGTKPGGMELDILPLI